MSANTDRSSLGGRRSGGPSVQQPQQNLCAFWLGEHCYGLETTLVGEVVEVDAVAPVPLAPAAVRGLFNLRGTPLALVDAVRVLDLPEPPMLDEARPGRPLVALVLRTEAIVLGLLIRRMEMVISGGRGVFSAPEPASAEHPVVAGFLELPDRGGLTVTVLDPEALLGRLDRLRYVDSSPG
jgi:purine-binding chemotaxis protein CheW